VTRGGRTKDWTEPERRCIVSGESGPTYGLIRFVRGPDGWIVPDLAEKLPGRGIWLTASRDAVAQAMKKRAFARAARAQVTVPEDLPDRLESLLARRLIDSLALANKAGLAVMGFEKVKARLKRGPVAAMIEARDGSERGFAKLLPLLGDAPVVKVLDSGELGLAFGRDYVIHAALDAGGATPRVLREATRLSGFRTGGRAPRWDDEGRPDAGGPDAALERPRTGR
jgi:predicted RNA-binding protein YlxR (DUF448 family)